MSGWKLTIPDQYRVYTVKGTSGNATGRLEYICEAAPDALLAASVWRIRKMLYDSAGFNTQVVWADGSKSFDKVANSYAGYTYTTAT